MKIHAVGERCAHQAEEGVSADICGGERWQWFLGQQGNRQQKYSAHEQLPSRHGESRERRCAHGGEENTARHGDSPGECRKNADHIEGGAGGCDQQNNADNAHKCGKPRRCGSRFLGNRSGEDEDENSLC